jgi:hypothetical protein
VYKALQIKDKRMYSIGLEITDERIQMGLILEYTEGNLIIPKIVHSKLIAFLSFDWARDWLVFETSARMIYECEASGVEEGRRMPLFITDIVGFWNGKMVQTVDPPLGTVFCDSIRLAKRISFDDRMLFGDRKV